jgi:hypothetical protein
MDSRPSVHSWKVLCWNIRGINTESKWESIRNKITESSCDVISIKKQRGTILILLILESFVLASLMLSVFFPPLVPLVVSLLSRKALCSLAVRSFTMIFQS